MTTQDDIDADWQARQEPEPVEPDNESALLDDLAAATFSDEDALALENQLLHSILGETT